MELIFVLIVIGIIAAFVIPNTRSNPLQEAAIQLVSHIRLTQHLALTDDRYDATDPKWYMEMWQIRFTPGNTSSQQGVAYVIYSDTSHTQHPEKNEIAVDPISGLYIDGGVVNNDYGDPDLLKNANLGKAYGVKDIDFTPSCSYHQSKRIAFDYLGRPIKGDVSSPSSSSTFLGALKYIQDTCRITLCSTEDCSISSKSEKVVILIEPETGYVRIE